jgi:serine/threonine protein phosphatase PrpC
VPAWLPLTRIRSVCDLCDTDRVAAVAEIREFWMRVEADTTARRELVDFLIEQLLSEPRKDAAMPRTAEPLEIRYAALSDTGIVRPENQDAAYAGPRLLAVADGFGEQGDAASNTAINAREIDEVESGDLLNVLRDAAGRAHTAVAGIGGQQTGSTLTALLWTGSQLGLVHIGDSRAYLLRDDRLFQITHDHTLVRSMLDEGRITPQEAESHPQRSLLVQALGSDQTVPDPQFHVADVQPGDRYLLCTDGLSANVPEPEIRCALQTTPADPAEAVRALIELSTRAGGTDNVACVVADVVDS